MKSLVSEQLREQYDDLGELYQEAKMNDNSILMEKLIKAMSALAKQVLAHEIHEKESLSRNECRRLANIMGIAVGKAIKRHYPDDDRSALIIDDIHETLTEMSEDKEL
jgi:hypothetical protein